MRKKRVISILVLVMFIFNIAPVWAEMPNGSVIIGDKAFSLNYVNEEKNSSEIQEAIREMKDGKIIVKNMGGDWYNNDGSRLESKDAIPKTLYKDSEGKYSLYRENGEKIGIDILISEEGKEISNDTIKGNLYIKGDNVTIKDCSVEGTVFVDPGKEGETNLKDVQAEQIVVISGGKNSIHFENVQSERLTVDSVNTVRIESTGNTKIQNTVVYSGVIVDSKSGTFGKIEVDLKPINDENVELRGTFKDEILIKSSVNISAKEAEEVQKIIIAAEEKSDTIVISGKMNSIEINKESNIKLQECTVEEIVANAEAQVEVDKNSKVEKVDTKGNDIEISGDGEVLKEENSEVVEEQPYYGTKPKPTPEPKPEPLPVDKTTPSAISFNLDGEDEIKIFSGEEKELNLTIDLKNGGFEDYIEWSKRATGSSITWSSDNEKVAVVENGMLRGESKGTANISVNVQYKDAHLFDQVKVTVNEKTLTREMVDVNILNNPGYVNIDIDENVTFIGEVVFSDSTTSAAVTWEIQDENVAVVDKNGTVTGVKPGTTELAAWCKSNGKKLMDSVRIIVDVPKEGIHSSNGLVQENEKEYSLRVKSGSEAKRAVFITSQRTIDKDVIVYAGKGETVELVDFSIDGKLIIEGTEDGEGTVILNRVVIHGGEDQKIIVNGVAEHSLHLLNGTSAGEIEINDTSSRIDMQDSRIGAINVLGSEKSEEDSQVVIEVSDDTILSDVVTSNENMKIKDNTTGDKKLQEVIGFIQGDEVDLEKVEVESQESSNLKELGKQTNTVSEFEEKLKKINELYKSPNGNTEMELYLRVGRDMKLLIENLHNMNIMYDEKVFALPEEYFQFSLDTRIQFGCHLNARIRDYYDSNIETLPQLKEVIDATLPFQLREIEMQKLKGRGKEYKIDGSSLNPGDQLVDILGLKEGKTPVSDFYTIEASDINSTLVDKRGDSYYLTRNYMTRNSSNSKGETGEFIDVPIFIDCAENIPEELKCGSSNTNLMYFLTGLPVAERDNIASAEIIKKDGKVQILIEGSRLKDVLEKMDVYFNGTELQLGEMNRLSYPENELGIFDVLNGDEIQELEGFLKIQFGENREFEYRRKFDLKVKSEFEEKYFIELITQASYGYEINVEDFEKAEDFSADNKKYIIKFKIKNAITGEYVNETDNLYVSGTANNAYGVIETYRALVVKSSEEDGIVVEIPMIILEEPVKNYHLLLNANMDGNRIRRHYRMMFVKED